MAGSSAVPYAAAKSRQKFKSTVIAVALLVVAAVGFIAYKALERFRKTLDPRSRLLLTRANSGKTER